MVRTMLNRPYFDFGIFNNIYPFFFNNLFYCFQNHHYCFLDGLARWLVINNINNIMLFRENNNFKISYSMNISENMSNWGSTLWILYKLIFHRQFWKLPKVWLVFFGVEADNVELLLLFSVNLRLIHGSVSH